MILIEVKWKTITLSSVDHARLLEVFLTPSQTCCDTETLGSFRTKLWNFHFIISLMAATSGTSSLSCKRVLFQSNFHASKQQGYLEDLETSADSIQINPRWFLSVISRSVLNWPNKSGLFIHSTFRYDRNPRMINSWAASGSQAIYISSNLKTMPTTILIILLPTPPPTSHLFCIPDWAGTLHHQSFFLYHYFISSELFNIAAGTFHSVFAFW